MIEKSQDRFGSEGCQRELINRAVLTVRKESQKKPEGGSVAGARFGAELTLCGEVVGEEPLYQSR